MSIRVGSKDGQPVKNYFKVWKIEESNGYIKAQCSTGRKKNKDSADWINSSWWLGFVGNCKDKAKEIKEGDTIITSEFQVENAPDANKKYWLTVTVFSFEIQAGQTDNGGFTPVDGEDDLPF